MNKTYLLISSSRKTPLGFGLTGTEPVVLTDVL